MGMLSDDFPRIIHAIGMNELKHPIFYNSPVGIRFKIGGDERVYLDDVRSEKYIANPAYISATFDRAKAIYTNLPHKPNILRIDGYTDESSVQKEIRTICQVGDMPPPHNFILFHLYDDRGADLVATDKEFLRPIYEKFNSWILNYDREKINPVFEE